MVQRLSTAPILLRGPGLPAMMSRKQPEAVTTMQTIGICRFSYPGDGGFQVEHASLKERMDYLYAPARMAERFATFETMMLPPLKAQTDGDFTFLIVIGNSLPRPYRDRLEAAVATLPQAVIKAYPPGPHRKVMQDAINSVRRFDGNACLQFRMDDDDAVACTFVERLRETALDVLPMAAKHRHIAIDFNQGFIARPSALGLEVAPTNTPYTTAGLALMFQPDLRLSVMNFAHMKVGQKMPTVTFAGEDMLIRGHNDHNDSRQKPGIKSPRLTRLDAVGKAHFKATYAIDEDAVAAAFAGLSCR
ncbi:putative rhamnosyl transferase [Sulfitobacter sp. F26204]|uniref:putative rhamnosyl transferase n=1 Tax=Sulfitobacter sp. F26204 TaxID=2996014 RepID=UPI00225DCE07|nr:putative rhamnosyl transferase [Sulfitobacter sp. F26204]MCX7561860.1 putative rhamnosyl transferase [Sulfitobacter sp. F26204]